MKNQSSFYRSFVLSIPTLFVYFPLLTNCQPALTARTSSSTVTDELVKSSSPFWDIWLAVAPELLIGEMAREFTLFRMERGDLNSSASHVDHLDSPKIIKSRDRWFQREVEITADPQSQTAASRSHRQTYSMLFRESFASVQDNNPSAIGKGEAFADIGANEYRHLWWCWSRATNREASNSEKLENWKRTQRPCWAVFWLISWLNQIGCTCCTWLETTEHQGTFSHVFCHVYRWK